MCDVACGSFSLSSSGESFSLLSFTSHPHLTGGGLGSHSTLRSCPASLACLPDEASPSPPAGPFWGRPSLLSPWLPLPSEETENSRKSQFPETYLERAKGQFKEQLDLHGVLWGEGEDDVVDSEEGDQQEGGLGQAPADTDPDPLPSCPLPLGCSSTYPACLTCLRPADVPQDLCGSSFYSGDYLAPMASPQYFWTCTPSVYKIWTRIHLNNFIIYRLCACVI